MKCWYPAERWRQKSGRRSSREIDVASSQDRQSIRGCCVDRSGNPGRRANEDLNSGHVGCQINPRACGKAVGIVEHTAGLRSFRVRSTGTVPNSDTDVPTHACEG